MTSFALVVYPAKLRINGSLPANDQPVPETGSGGLCYNDPMSGVKISFDYRFHSLNRVLIDKSILVTFVKVFE